MIPVTEIAAFIGVTLAAAAYLPQILHLVREHCAAGISRSAFGAWLLAALLITSHAVAAGEAVFIALGIVQITATAIVLFYAKRYASSFCAGHAPGPPHLTRSAGDRYTRVGASRSIPARSRL
ncbi:MAG TPA: PQ-loop repeat-containing protein [Actinomycetota bacterium]|nr:PQ-loop repeat-containing protein [Actinomycetota bacterium]